MNCEIYLRNGTVYIPTMGKMDEGFYRAVEPVAVVSATNVEALCQALQAALARGNPTVPMLKRGEWPPPILLKYADVKSWSTFERGLRLWDLKEEDGTYRISANMKQPNGMWKEDRKQTITLPPGTSAEDVANRLIAILQNPARNNT